MPQRDTTAFQDLPLPLRQYMERDRDGHLTFCWPYEVGAYNSQVNHIQRKLNEALSRRGAAKTAALRDLKKFVDEVQATHKLVSDQWDAECDRRRASSDEFFKALNQPAGTAANAVS